MRTLVCSLVASVCLLSGGAVHTQSKAGANTHAVYKQLRGIAVTGDAFQVTDFVLTKDAATFTLTGTLHLVGAVQGKVTGAVFLGKGTMAYTPPLAAERSMLRNLTR